MFADGQSMRAGFSWIHFDRVFRSGQGERSFLCLLFFIIYIFLFVRQFLFYKSLCSSLPVLCLYVCICLSLFCESFRLSVFFALCLSFTPSLSSLFILYSMYILFSLQLLYCFFCSCFNHSFSHYIQLFIQVSPSLIE